MFENKIAELCFETVLKLVADNFHLSATFLAILRNVDVTVMFRILFPITDITSNTWN